MRAESSKLHPSSSVTGWLPSPAERSEGMQGASGATSAAKQRLRASVGTGVRVEATGTRERNDPGGPVPPPIDLEHARRETPGCEHVLHFNNAGAALMPQPVLDATVGHLQLEARIGGYEAEARAREALEGIYDSVAALIGCHRD